MPETTSIFPTRPITQKASRRSWNEPAVRGWWVSAGVLLLIVGGLFLQQIFVARDSRYRLTHWTRIDKAMIEKIGREVLKSYRASPEMLPAFISTLSYTDAQGKVHEVEGYLVAQTEARRPGETIPILVDPERPDRWTDRVKALPIFEEVIAPILLVPLPLFCVLRAWWKRRMILSIWQKGIEREAQILGHGHSAVAPGSLVLRCLLDTARGGRLVKVTVPRSVARFEAGDSIFVITPASESGWAIARMLYE